jgi:Tol biopolymer transport system component/DNA-binding winged helix-turn-helix (wHTH) protein
MSEQYRWDDFVLDLDAFRLTRAGVPLPLEPKAINLLALMVRRPDHLFTKQEIFEAIWPGTAVTDHALTRIVAQLRRALGDEAREAKYIETVPTRGYRWIRPVENTPPLTVDRVAPHAASVGRRVSSRVVAGLALSIMLGGVLLWTQRGVPTSAVATLGTASDVQWPVQVTTYAGLDFQPALSPQGHAVAFASDRTGTFEIYVRAFGGSATETPVTSDKGQNVQPAWSPDGNQIAYHSSRRGGIWVIPARGGVAKQVALEGSNPAWSPDGSRIVFQSDEHSDVSPSGYGAQSGSTIWMVDVMGGSARQLTRGGHPIGGHANPVWSNDGRYVAFSVFEGGPGNGIWLVDPHSGNTRPLERGFGLFELAFAPDDSALYAAGGEPVIVKLPFDRASGTISGSRELIAVPGVPRVRGLTIGAGRLAFAGLTLSSQIWAQPLDDTGSGVGPAQPLTADTSRRNSLPMISPDGSNVAYVSTRSGELPNVWVMDITGRNAIQLTSDQSADHKPNWFPDGRRVAYISNRNGTSAVWSVDITSRREQLMFDMAQVRSSMTTAAARGWLAELEIERSMTQAAFSLIAPPTGRRILYVTGMDPFAPRAISNPNLSIGYPAWSPDGRHLAVEIKDGSSTHAGVIDAETSVLRKLTSTRGQTWVRSWAPDGRRVAAAVLREGVWSLRWIDAESGREGIMTPAGPPHVYVRYPSWSPRANLVVFERGEVRGNIWTLARR